LLANRSAKHVGKIDNRGLRSKIYYFPEGAIFPLVPRRRLVCSSDLYDARKHMLQSMAQGPTISRCDGAVEFLRDGENGFVLPRPRDEASVLAVVRRALSSDESVRRRLALAARETMTPLTWDAHLEKWMSAIGEIRER
jgi:glycosyltransferase involved in cell wall biosynthesis